MVRKWLEGEPRLLVSDGKVLYEHMREEGVEIDELLMAAREHEVERISEISRRLLEVDGTISIVPKETKGKGSQMSMAQQKKSTPMTKLRKRYELQVTSNF